MRIVQIDTCPECGGSGLAADGERQCLCCAAIGEVSRELFNLAAGEWMPIEEAPRDGRPILVDDGIRPMVATAIYSDRDLSEIKAVGYTRCAVINLSKEAEHDRG